MLSVQHRANRLPRLLGAVLLLVVALVAPAQAAELYFSDCGYHPTAAPQFLSGAICDYSVLGQPSCQTCYGQYPHNYCFDRWDCAVVEGGCSGSAGSLTNPLCIGFDELGPVSFAAVQDGGASGVGGIALSDLSPGDTIYLCAGLCDGSGEATYYLGQPASTTWLTGLVDNLTVRTYPGETVILSGDTNGNGVPDAGEMNTAMKFGSGISGWTIGSGDKSLIFERWGASGGTGPKVFDMDSNAGGFTFDGIVVRNTNRVMWSGLSVYDAGCRSANGSPNETGGFIFYDWGRNGAANTFKNSRFYNLCGMIWRDIVATAGATIIQDNEGWNGSQLSNSFQSTQGLTISRNKFSDFYSGFGVEERMTNVVIEDNEISCPGNYKLSSDGRCVDAIYVDDGNNGLGGTVTTGITIRRNKIWASAAGAFAGSTVGWFLNPIKIDFTTDVAAATVVENNMIWHHWGWANDTLGGRLPDSEFAGPAIFISSNRDEITVQNNTVYDSKVGIVLDGATTGRAYTVKNNLIVRSRKSTTAKPAIIVTSRATGSTVSFNIVDRNVRTSTTEQIAWVNGAYKTCSDMPTLGLGAGSNNSCPTPPGTFVLFKGCDSATYCAPPFLATAPAALATWDLHLSGVQQAVDAGTTGATLDIDREPRPGGLGTDIGADENYGPLFDTTPEVNATPSRRN